MNMTSLENLISDEIESIRRLKVGGTNAPLTEWGKGYNQGIENAANVAESLIRLILLKA